MRPASSSPTDILPPAAIVVTIGESFEANPRVAASTTDSGKEGRWRRMEGGGDPPRHRPRPDDAIHIACAWTGCSLSQMNRCIGPLRFTSGRRSRAPRPPDRRARATAPGRRSHGAASAGSRRRAGARPCRRCVDSTAARAPAPPVPAPTGAASGSDRLARSPGARRRPAASSARSGCVPPAQRRRSSRPGSRDIAEMAARRRPGSAPRCRERPSPTASPAPADPVRSAAGTPGS